MTHMSGLLPVDRVLEMDTLIAFHHPRPDYAIHILLVPKRAIPDLLSLTPEDSQFLSELFQAIQVLIGQFDLDKKGYRLVVNGGNNQVFPYLHFHFISDD